MTPEEIRAKALELAAFYTAKANGKTLQYAIALEGPNQWMDYVDGTGPHLASELSNWRVKPEPRRMWETPSASAFSNNHNARTYHQDEADKWRSRGCTVTEWMEVLP